MFIGIAIIIGALFGLMALFGLTQPRIVKLDRSTTIKGDKATIFSEIANLRNFVTWSPWTAKDPNIKMTFKGGEDGTPGSSYVWKGNNKVGEGSMTVNAIAPNDSVVLDIDFGFRGQAKATFTLEEQGDQTKVTWAFESDMGGNPIVRCGQPVMRSIIGKDFSKGLNNLKNKVEAQ